MPELKGSIAMLQTPVIAIAKKDKLVRWIYSLSEDVKVNTGETSNYYKGLGSWDVDDLKQVIETDGIAKMIDVVDWDTEELIHDWLSSSQSDKRKEYLMANEFSIAKV